MKVPRLKAAIAALAAIPLVLAATPNVASADPTRDFVWVYWQAPGSVNAGGYAAFFPYGEHLRVQDWLRDDWGTRAQVQKLLPDSNGVLHWVNHSTSCFDDNSRGDTSPGGPTTCNYSIPEGVTVRVHIWATHDGATKEHEYSPAIKA